MARPLMPAQTARRALLRAALAGALVAASPFLPITLVLAVGSVPRAFTSVSEALLLLPFAILPLLVTFPLVLAISVSVGLPVTRLLTATHRRASCPMVVPVPPPARSSPRFRLCCWRSTTAIGS